MLVLALIADDVSLTPRDDVLIDIDDKEPLIPVQVWKKLQRWEDTGFLLCMIWGNLCGYRAGVESDADVRSCLVVAFLLQLQPLFSAPLLHRAMTNSSFSLAFKMRHQICFSGEETIDSLHARLFPSASLPQMYGLV